MFSNFHVVTYSKHTSLNNFDGANTMLKILVDGHINRNHRKISESSDQANKKLVCSHLLSSLHE